MKYIFLLIIFSVSLLSKVDITLSHTQVKHGTTFAVVLQSDKDISPSPTLIYQNKKFHMFPITNSIKSYRVFVPVDYYAKKQKEYVEINYKLQNKFLRKNIEIEIVDGHYKQNEIIKVPQGKVTLSKKNKQRSKTEYAQVYKEVYSKITSDDLTNNEEYIYPIGSKITSAFGNARLYNGITKSYHTGTDFRAKVGTSIYASNNGIVALTMDRFYLGKVIYIDHGRGAFSYYSHMSSFGVKQGEKVLKGQKIGESGVTGRITGPHLHYAMRLYNTTVDPLQYTELYNKILKLYQ